MWRIRIRWRAVLGPVCAVHGHVWLDVHAFTAFDRSGRSCERCLRFEVFQHEGWQDPPNSYLLKRDADGNILGKWVKA